MIVYLDTSVALRILLRQPGALRRWGRWERVVSCELFRVEARRVIDRLRLESALDDAGVAQAQEALMQMEDSIDLVQLTPALLRRAAAPMPTVVKTLDALHLAAALGYRERHDPDLVFGTHDLQQTTAARALGFKCIG